MAGIKSLVGLAFMGSIGLLFLFLACALPGYNWWPFFVVMFYVIAPIPTLIMKRFSDEPSALKDVCAFFTSGIVLSAFALPFVLARAPVVGGGSVILWGSCGLVCVSNIVMFATLFAFFRAFDDDSSSSYSNW